MVGASSAKRYTKKTRSAVVSSSLDPLQLPAAVAHTFVCKKTGLEPLPPIGRRGMGCVYNMKADSQCCQITENSAKKLKYAGRKKYLTAKNWSGILTEVAENSDINF